MISTAIGITNHLGNVWSQDGWMSIKLGGLVCMLRTQLAIGCAALLVTIRPVRNFT